MFLDASYKHTKVIMKRSLLKTIKKIEGTLDEGKDQVQIGRYMSLLHKYELQHNCQCCLALSTGATSQCRDQSMTMTIGSCTRVLMVPSKHWQMRMESMSTSFTICVNSLHCRRLVLPMVTRFPNVGENGYLLLKETLGAKHADCCMGKKAVSIVVFFGYTLLGMINVVLAKGC